MLELEVPLSKVRAQVIWAHPRVDSLTATVVGEVVKELNRAGAEVDQLDLYREGFDSSLREADEPDWNNPDKPYSREVILHASRTKAANIVFFVFPVWWFSLPAIMKGYIDRVWNHGLFYGGGRKANIPKIRWIALAGETQEFFAKRDYDRMLQHHLNIGIAGFCGVNDSRVDLLYNALGASVTDAPSHYAQFKDRAREIVRSALA
ncbi:NAD(P)H oxidoreductase [Pseudarthrobacter phenanthrenivorans]|uniref:NAD(P)H oxidoreductase n=1 Tax=Pseudarthrobacter phenanthrenivorans TaxID=361575 RepID=A0A3B0FAF2_PSEPS|nr:NAD(P)H oxidoreductase [Pseudarthrobacter phenanthrenivorans]